MIKICLSFLLILTAGPSISSWSGLFKMKQSLMKFDVICFAFFNEFKEEDEAHEVLWKAIVAYLDASVLVGSINTINALFSSSGFNSNEKFGLLRYSVKRVHKLDLFFFIALQ